MRIGSIEARRPRGLPMLLTLLAVPVGMRAPPPGAAIRVTIRSYRGGLNPPSSFETDLPIRRTAQGCGRAAPLLQMRQVQTEA